MNKKLMATGHDFAQWPEFRQGYCMKGVTTLYSSLISSDF
jgi:hypothetical protein